MTIRTRLTGAMSALILVVSLLAAVTYYLVEARRDLASVDASLLRAATFVRSELPTRYHDRIVDQSSVSAAEYDRLVDENNHRCRLMGLQYLWSVLVIDPKTIVFTSATSPSHDLSKRDHAEFFALHKDPSAFAEALAAMRPTFGTFHNDWGYGRMVLVPERDVRGRVFMVGASIDIDHLMEERNRRALVAVATVSFVLFCGFLLSFWLARSLSTPILGLTRVAEEISQGRFSEHRAASGAAELVSLSDSINRMSRTIDEKIAALQQSEEKYRRLLDNLGDRHCIFSRTAEGEFLYVSGSFRTLFGIPGEEMIGRDWRSLNLTPESLAASEESDRRLMSERRAQTAELTCIHPDGSRRIIELSCGPVVEGDRVVRMEGVCTDITARKAAQEALLASENRLRQAEKLQAIGQIAGGIAHDFNNQLCGIMGAAELLGAGVRDPEDRRLLELILQAARRSADLTGQLLAYARKGKVLSVPVDVHALIGDVTALLERSIDKRIVVTRSLAASSHRVLGDPTQLQSALLNLALNARDAMPGGGELGFSTSIVSSPDPSLDPELVAGCYVKISVSDTGTGMDPETKARLFEPFFTTKGLGKGTGLGLAAVHGTVKSHHGAVLVQSEPGHGTTFSLYLPLLEAEEVVAPGERAGAAVPGAGRVLVVDDERAIREVVREMLRGLGYEATVFADGEAAVRHYRENWRTIDLVILDMVMPKLGGRDTFRAMRAINPSLRALLASGYSVDGEAQAILDEGVLGFVQKPFSLVELSRHLTDALRQQS